MVKRTSGDAPFVVLGGWVGVRWARFLSTTLSVMETTGFVAWRLSNVWPALGILFAP